MFRIIRRAPWIAIGAGAAYYLDPDSGPTRRRDTAERARAWTRRVREEWLDRPGPDPGPRASDSSTVPPVSADAPLTPSVPEDRVKSRAGAPLAEEEAAGVPGPARDAMAEQILADSERRVTDRAHTGAERRRSEETVETVETVSGAG